MATVPIMVDAEVMFLNLTVSVLIPANSCLRFVNGDEIAFDVPHVRFHFFSTLIKDILHTGHEARVCCLLRLGAWGKCNNCRILPDDFRVRFATRNNKN